jgi:hypothetical protein
VESQCHIQVDRRSGKRPVTHCTRRWGPWPVWTGAENLSPTEIRSPDHQARSESLYRLRYPGPHAKCEGRKRLWSFAKVYCGRCLEVIRENTKNVIQNCPLRLKFETRSSRYRCFTLFGERSKALPYLFPIFFVLCCSFGLCILLPCSGVEFHVCPLI